MVIRSLTIGVLSLGVASLGCGKKEEDENKEEVISCGFYDCPAAEPSSVSFDGYGVSGTLVFDRAPLSLEGARFFALVDELSIYSDERSRIIEEEFEMEIDEDEFRAICTTYSDGGCHCGGGDGSYYLSSTGYSARAIIHGSLRSTSALDFEFGYDFPDSRSAYFLGVLVDMDGDGIAGPGDYITNDFVKLHDEISYDDMHLDLNSIAQDEELLLDIKVRSWEDLELADEASLRIVLQESTSERVVAEQGHKVDVEQLLYSLSAVLPKEIGLYEVSLEVDANANGELDEDDYVAEAKQTVEEWGAGAKYVFDLIPYLSE